MQGKPWRAFIKDARTTRACPLLPAHTVILPVEIAGGWDWIASLFIPVSLPSITASTANSLEHDDLMVRRKFTSPCPQSRVVEMRSHHSSHSKNLIE
ncbi:hypothetical protein BU25DRAFT_108565 [Macroventuria anomochaeta]|uniref:Uncharacterized protein n=1 Tax=Macroventuria anomochaeta TaxID=301207 RepID=A0ACB6RXL4_9PLEO|nr:uncharacterized protein BU25DRAFT_108565 [Macroventuria anomochaeta]KAF2625674.1 hypothetical protein BU25DRAFT_108565 [Macroventuria anomochaeta]